MLLALMALAAAANWVPMRWPASDPGSLAWLAGSPINCILLEPDAWRPDLVSAARAKHLSVLGLPRSPADVDRGAALKLDGVVFEGVYDAALALRARAAGLMVVELPNRHAIRFDSRDPIVGTSQGLWPGLEIEHGGKTAGPTSSPWINTNGGFLRFARAATDAAIWIGVRPPPRTIFPVERYAQAIGDAALTGARWILALDDDLQRRLLAGDRAAVKDWTAIKKYVGYYESHPEWRGYRAYGRMAVIQDTGSGGLLSGSLLDMLASQRASVRVIPPNRLNGESLRDAKVVLDVDPDVLSPQQKHAIDEFVKAGGVLVNPPAKWKFPQSSDDQILLERRQADKLQSLWEVTYNATVRKNFGARAFNTVGILTSVLAPADGRSVIVHLLNFTDFSGEAVTVHVLGKWKRARLYRLEGPPLELPVFAVPDGTGVEIEKVSLLATLQLE